MTGFLTQHWFLSCGSLLVLSFFKETRKIAKDTALSAIAVGLVMLILLLLRYDPACRQSLEILTSWWVEISVVSGVLISYLPSAGTVIRGIIAIPIAWLAVLIWDLVWNCIENAGIALLSIWFENVAEFLGMIGNIINIVALMALAILIAGDAHRPVSIVAGVLIILVELAMMFSSLHTCSIAFTFIGNETLNLWQWIDLSLSAITVGLILYADISSPKKETIDP